MQLCQPLRVVRRKQGVLLHQPFCKPNEMTLALSQEHQIVSVVYFDQFRSYWYCLNIGAIPCRKVEVHMVNRLWPSPNQASFCLALSCCTFYKAQSWETSSLLLQHTIGLEIKVWRISWSDCNVIGVLGWSRLIFWEETKGKPFCGAGISVLVNHVFGRLCRHTKLNQKC